MVEKVVYRDILYALIIKANFKKEGVEFFTENDFPVQMGYMNREKGYTIARHKHSPVNTHPISGMSQEILIIRSGKIKVDIYSTMDEWISTVVVESGDVIMFLKGGHGFEMLEASEFLEIKQGPFGGTYEKIPF